MQEPDLQQIAEQLRCPTGDFGMQMGQSMAESNKPMTSHSIQQLALKDTDQVLELGHGICTHLAEMLQEAPSMHYQGLEISPLMQQQAMSVNQTLMNDHDVVFSLYDGMQIPFGEASFDKVMSVNTIYFWSPVHIVMDEIARVLKPNGLAVITYAQKQFMQTLPFVGQQFQLYEDSDVAQLAADGPLKVIEFIEYKDRAKSKSGEMVDRQYTIAVLRKDAS